MVLPWLNKVFTFALRRVHLTAGYFFLMVHTSVRKAITRDRISCAVMLTTALLQDEDNPPNGAKYIISSPWTTPCPRRFLCCCKNPKPFPQDVLRSTSVVVLVAIRTLPLTGQFFRKTTNREPRISQWHGL